MKGHELGENPTHRGQSHDESQCKRRMRLLPPGASIFVLELLLVRYASATVNKIKNMGNRVQQPFGINRFVVQVYTSISYKVRSM